MVSECTSPLPKIVLPPMEFPYFCKCAVRFDVDLPFPKYNKCFMFRENMFQITDESYALHYFEYLFLFVHPNLPKHEYDHYNHHVY